MVIVELLLGGAAVAQPRTSQVSASAGSAGERILGMLNMSDTDWWIHV